MMQRWLGSIMVMGSVRGRWEAGPWKAAVLVLLLCVCSWSLPAGVRALRPFGTNISALPLSEQYLYTCKGVVLTYTVDENVERIMPVSEDNATQPYKFEAKGTLTNAGFNELENWELFIGFQHDEVLAAAPGLIISDGSEKTPGALVGNGTTIIGIDSPDLLTSINTAEDLDLIQVKYSLTGTEFGIGPDQPIDIPLPKNITLLNPGYKCAKPEKEENVTLVVCCKENRTIEVSTKKLSKRETGDLTIYFDVITAFKTSYTAQVTIEMNQQIGRIDHWNLTWDWLNNEFIDTMKGAQTLEQVQEECLEGPILKAYPDRDFSAVMSCQRTPSIVDLDTDGSYDYTNPKECCRNGSLLPAAINPKAGKSAFLLTVMKGIKQDSRDLIDPPQNWRISDLNKPTSQNDYKCGLPKMVSPSEFDAPGLRISSAAKTWQITCNATVIQPKTPRKCCVSFSGFYNSSVIPCPTCACAGCASLTKGKNPQCNPNIDPMLLPTYSLLLPPSNRTKLADDLAKIESWPIPTPRPCPDNCGMTINWHVYSDYTNGFSTRITLFNWDVPVLPDWFLAIELDKNLLAGYLDTYSFNGSTIIESDTKTKTNKTLIFLKGKEFFNNYLNGLEKGLIPGKVQSLMSFDKRMIKYPNGTRREIDVIGGDGFPKSVWFNGDECALPEIFPLKAAAGRSSALSTSTAILSLIFSTFIVLASGGFI